VLTTDVAQFVAVPVERRGEMDMKGKAVLNWPGGFTLRIEGTAEGRNFAYRDEHVRVDDIDFRSDFVLTQSALSLPRFRASVLGGTFDGRAEFKDDFERLEVEGTARGIALEQVTRVTGRPRLAWSGNASGPVRINGLIAGGPPRNFTVQANMNIQRAGGGIPIQGNVDLIYDQRAGALRLGNSLLTTDQTEIRVAGTLGEILRVSMKTSNLDELLPGIAMIDENALKEMPVKLAGGTATADAVIEGPLENPVITARVISGPLEFEGRRFEHASADITASSAGLEARNIFIAQNGARVTGGGQVKLDQWRVTDHSALSAKLNVRNADVKRLLTDLGRQDEITGMLTAEAIVTGTVSRPEASLEITVDRPAAFGEKFEQLRARGRVTGDFFEITSGALKMPTSQLEFTAAYIRAASGWATGSLRFHVAGSGMLLDQFERVRSLEAGLTGQLALRAIGVAHVRNGDLDVDTLDSQIRVSGVALGASPIGNLNISARTRGDVLQASVEGAVRGSKISGSGEWRLEGDYPGRAQVEFGPLPLAALHEIAMRGKVDQGLPFIGSIVGNAVVTGPLKKPDALKAEIVLPNVEIRQNPAQPALRGGTPVQDLTLRNTEPVRLTATIKSVDIASARFASTGTNLGVNGRVAFDSKSPWDVVVRGQINLAILQLFNADLLAQGSAVADAMVRGTLTDPQVTGRLELKNASLYLRDLPAGVDNANGMVTFDRTRANIERLTAEVGGGRVAFGGFIGFGSGLLLYRVQGSADEVRFRHPDGVSVTVSALLNLTGTSDNSLISGTVTVLRAGFAPRADLGGLLAQSAKPLAAPTAPSEYLRGLNLDVRIESGPSLVFQTSLARDLQAEAELRLRGNAARPVLLGDISVSQGEIQFFGNKYLINRAEVHFLNPTKLEPVFDVDLETRARGITVNISFSGTLNKLNLAYRSDPPLQTNDIIALLAVGRDPTMSAFANVQARGNLLQSGANTLGQAVAAPVSSRLQRFFGVSRLKIDPQLTGVENIPQARLTLEQQVSRDVTLTYITNLTRTEEQIVRIQWDINRQWSAIAVREANGVFGIDFQYRKRFR
jgi:translocation and assembly module TamB